jgi:hypothetical protein
MITYYLNRSFDFIVKMYEIMRCLMPMMTASFVEN